MRIAALLLTILLGFTIFLAPAEAQETNLLTNGSFEFWSHYGTERLEELLKEGPNFDDKDPLLPVRWEWNARKPSKMARSADAHGGQYSLSIISPQGAGACEFSLGMLEVAPEADYSFGVWAKGSGHVEIYILGQAVEGMQELAKASGDAMAGWRRFGGKLKVPGHIRLVTLKIVVGAPAQVLLDDAHISASLDIPHNADDVLGKKESRDDNTLLFEDFETKNDQIKLDEKCHLTEPTGGRFGRGLRVEKPGQAFIPLKLPKMPEEGTIELWLSPDRMPHMIPGGPGVIHVFLEVRSAAQELAYLQADTSVMFRWNWRTDNETYGKKNSVAASSSISLRRMRKGQWTHVAITWDPSAVRMYVDGILADMQTQPPLGWWDAPVSIAISAPYAHSCWDGAIDELRVSKVKRFGPFTPKGATPKPLPAARVAALPREPEKPKPGLDFAAERKKLIDKFICYRPGIFENTPNPEGQYLYEAAVAKPTVASGANVTFEPDKILKGLTTAFIGNKPFQMGDPSYRGVYWRLNKIVPAKYWIGVVYQSNDEAVELPTNGANRFGVFLNGRAVQLSTASDPIQVAPNVWFSEAQGADAEALKEGDEIAALPQPNYELRVVRLVLRPREPERGAHRLAINFGGHWNLLDSALRISAETEFLAAEGKPIYDPMDWGRQEQAMELPGDLLRGPDGRAIAHCYLTNPFSVPIEVDYECVVRGYYRQEAGRDAAKLTLEPHSRMTRKVSFETTADDPAYSITARLEAVKAPELGWPPHDTVSFFPGYRHSMPWESPFSYKDHRRVYFKQALPGERQTIDLNGQWELALTTSLEPPMPPPGDMKFRPRAVPFKYWQLPIDKITPRPHGAYIRRKVNIPDVAAAKTYRLVIASVVDEATAYVNGVKVGNVRGENTPLVADATKAIRPGENEIVVVLRDILAIMNPDYVNRDNPTPSGSYLDAPGLAGVNHLSMMEASLEILPAVSTYDILAIPSFRKKTIGARMSAINHSNATVKAKVKVTVLDERKPVLELGEKEISLEPEKAAPVSFEQSWQNARLWSLDDPHLYVLAVEITDVSTGKRLDFARERFGFRESWIEGNRIYFNGYPVKLKGGTAAVPYGINCEMHLGRGAKIPDWTDEAGFLVTEEITGVYNTPSKHNVERDVFWETARGNLLLAAARKQNHPSIVAWDLSNEWLSFLGYSGSDPLLGAKRLMTLTETILKQDPTRWTFYDGDEDLNGLLNNYSFHYMLEATHPHPVVGFGLNGHAVHFPDGAFWRPLERDFQSGEEVVANSYRGIKIRHGEKVVMNTENLWKVSRYMPPGPSKFVGEEDVLSPVIDSSSGPMVWMWKQNIDGHRDLGTSSISSYPLVGVHRRGYPVQTFIMPDTAHHAFSGKTVTRKFDILNDRFHPAKMSLRWKLVGPDGLAAAQGADEKDMATGDLQLGSLSFKAPAVGQRTKFTLQLDLLADGKFVMGEERDIEIWPDTPVKVAPLERKILLYDPSGETAAALGKAGARFETCSDLAAPSGDAKNLTMIIAENTLDEKSAAKVPALSAFVEAGARVVILAQKVKPEGLPVKTTFEAREWSSQPFVRVPIHPVLDAVSSWDLHFWSPDRVSARGAYSKPEGGPALPLVDSGNDNGLEWVQMMEMYRGKGLYFVCQLPLISKYDEDPMARELMARVVNYAAGHKAFRSPSGRIQLIAGPDSAVDKRLRELNIACDVVQPGAGFDAESLVFVEALAPATQENRAAWKEALEKGATFVVLGADPQSAPWLTALAGQKVRVTVPRYRMWEGRGYRNGFDVLTAGLSQIDLYWKRYDGAEAASSQAEKPEYAIEPLQDFSAQAVKAKEIVFPGALLEMSVGKGKLLVDQRRWATNNEKLTGLANRVACSLALGLNVQIGPFIPPRQLPANIVYRPVDLAPFANRSFEDDVAEDGKGGWSDQGPTADLRSFPTGQRSFLGVPFVVNKGPKGCIVLAARNRPGFDQMPREVTIPLGYRIEGLFFLHSAAYSRGQVGLYQIQYADGTTCDIPLILEENIRDWASGDQSVFPRERGTQSAVAWTGSCKMWPVISVLRMQWVNPYPEKVVQAVRFANPPLESVPILIGLTAALQKEQKETPVDTAKANELFIEAKKAADAGKPAEARALLKKAVEANPSFAPAHQALADICERQGDENGALEAYKGWAAAGARTPLPYNRIGEILEKRKDYRGALEAYTQSLQIEWNQMFLTEKKAQLEKLVDSK